MNLWWKNKEKLESCRGCDFFKFQPEIKKSECLKYKFIIDDPNRKNCK